MMKCISTLSVIRNITKRHSLNPIASHRITNAINERFLKSNWRKCNEIAKIALLKITKNVSLRAHCTAHTESRSITKSAVYVVISLYSFVLAQKTFIDVLNEECSGLSVSKMNNFYAADVCVCVAQKKPCFC